MMLAPSTTSMPQNVLAEDVPLFESYLSGLFSQKPTPKHECFSNISINNSGILFKGCRILPDSFGQYYYYNGSYDQGWGFPYKKKLRYCKFLVKNHLLSKKAPPLQDALWITDTWSEAYYHWHGEVIPRLQYAIDHGLTQYPLLLPSCYAHPWMQWVLRSYNINYHYTSENSIQTVARLHFVYRTAEMSKYNKNLVQRIAKHLFNATANLAKDTPPRIFISRAKADKRCITNEDEVCRVLKSYDFTVIHMETLSYPEQIAIMRNATHIIAQHGAGLTNMLYSRSGTKILEIVNPKPLKNMCHFFGLAVVLENPYYYLKAMPINDGRRNYNCNVTVDINQLHTALKQFLAS